MVVFDPMTEKSNHRINKVLVFVPKGKEGISSDSDNRKTTDESPIKMGASNTKTVENEKKGGGNGDDHQAQTQTQTQEGGGVIDLTIKKNIDSSHP